MSVAAPDEKESKDNTQWHVLTWVLVSSPTQTLTEHL